jgi:O-acetyl-ADP-ribose deacetylase (regulator of RNase III)
MEKASTIEIRKVGITSTGAQCVVNAANKSLKEGGGVCGVIFLAAGANKLQEACDAIGHCDPGDAVITPGFHLCEYIIHAVGPMYAGGKHNEAEQLYNCYKKSLDLAKENNIRSISFPLISSGIFGYPKEGAWRQALQACKDWTENNADYTIAIEFAIIDNALIELGFKVADELGVVISRG